MLTLVTTLLTLAAFVAGLYIAREVWRPLWLAEIEHARGLEAELQRLLKVMAHIPTGEEEEWEVFVMDNRYEAEVAETRRRVIESLKLDGGFDIPN
jgi:hypothetical protein